MVSSLQSAEFRVYLFSCSKTGKDYVGLTRYPLKVRAEGHYRSALRLNRTQLHRDLVKFGLSSFTMQTLMVCSQLKEAREKERAEIQRRGTNITGYNRTRGGEPGYSVRSEEVEKRRKEILSQAEELVRQFGFIPNAKTLQNAGYSALDKEIRKNGNLFSHLKQHRPHEQRKSLSKWVTEARRLALSYGGILPHHGRLVDMGLSGLAQMLQKHPKAFTGISQEAPHSHYKTPEQWVPVAEKLVRETGSIPNQKQLQTGDYGGLARAIRLRPDLFSHLPHTRLQRRPEEWAAIAASLAGNNGGILPSTGFLQKNGLRALDRMIRIHPHLFSRFKQEVKDSRGRIIAYKNLEEVHV